jgi:hypothetical protein
MKTITYYIRTSNNGDYITIEHLTGYIEMLKMYDDANIGLRTDLGEYEEYNASVNMILSLASDQWCVISPDDNPRYQAGAKVIATIEATIED